MAHKIPPEAVVAASGGEERKESGLLVVPVVVDEAAVSDDVPLRLRQGTGGHGELRHSAVGLHGVGVEGSVIAEHVGPDIGNKDVVSQLEDLRVFHQEGGHAPVDAVGAVALGGVGLGEVGGGSHDSLAGGGLPAGLYTLSWEMVTGRSPDGCGADQAYSKAIPQSAWG